MILTQKHKLSNGLELAREIIVPSIDVGLVCENCSIFRFRLLLFLDHSGPLASENSKWPVDLKTVSNPSRIAKKKKRYLSLRKELSSI